MLRVGRVRFLPGLHDALQPKALAGSISAWQVQSMENVSNPAPPLAGRVSVRLRIRSDVDGWRGYVLVMCLKLSWNSTSLRLFFNKFHFYIQFIPSPHTHTYWSFNNQGTGAARPKIFTESMLRFGGMFNAFPRHLNYCNEGIYIFILYVRIFYTHISFIFCVALFFH